MPRRAAAIAVLALLLAGCSQPAREAASAEEWQVCFQTASAEQNGVRNAVTGTRVDLAPEDAGQVTCFSAPADGALETELYRVKTVYRANFANPSAPSVTTLDQNGEQPTAFPVAAGAPAITIPKGGVVPGPLTVQLLSAGTDPYSIATYLVTFVD